MTELVDSFNVLWRLCAIIETINTVNVNQSAFVISRHQHLTTYGRAKAMAYKYCILDAVCIQHIINGMSKEGNIEFKKTVL